MMSLRIKEQLSQAVEDTATSAKSLVRLIASLNAHVDSLGLVTARACGALNDMTVNTGEVSRLLRLNRHLVKMEGVLNTVATTLMPSLAAKVANPEEPMVDYEMEAQMNYTSA